jgi:hypothetical protein
MIFHQPSVYDHFIVNYNLDIYARNLPVYICLKDPSFIVPLIKDRSTQIKSNDRTQNSPGYYKQVLGVQG